MTKRAVKGQTPKQQLASIRRQADRDIERRKRERVMELREGVGHAQRSRRDLILEAKTLCEVAARRLSKIHAARRAQLEHELAIERDAGVSQCRLATERAKRRGVGLRDEAMRTLHSERADQHTERVWLGKGRKRADPRVDRRKQAAVSRAERAQEAEDFAEQNIPHELVPLWRKMKSRIKESARMSRSEAFMHWVHDHQGEVYRMLEEQALADAKKLERRAEDEPTEDERYEAWEAERLRRGALGEQGDEPADFGDDAGDGDTPF